MHFLKKTREAPETDVKIDFSAENTGGKGVLRYVGGAEHRTGDAISPLPAAFAVFLVVDSEHQTHLPAIQVH